MIVIIKINVIVLNVVKLVIVAVVDKLVSKKKIKNGDSFFKKKIN
jgi:hypothetical protein